MPNIKEFDAGNLSLRPTEVGVDARAQTARRIGAFYNQEAGAQEMLAGETARLGAETARLGSETGELGAFKGSLETDTGRRIGSSIADAGDAAVKYLDNQQISQGSAAFANLLQQKTQQWNDIVKNPTNLNDPTIATKFQEGLEDDLEKFKNDGFYTENAQKWAEAHADALRMHMFEKTQADMSARAGQAAVVNAQQGVNSLSATVHSDPSSLDFSLAALRSSVEGIISSSPNLSSADAGRVREELLQRGSESIVKSAAIGYINKNSRIPPWATDPKYSPYVNGAELQMFERAAKTQQRSDMLMDKQKQLYDKQIADQKVHAAGNKVMTDNITIDPKTSRPIINPQFYKDSLDIVRNNPDAPSAALTARTLLDWGEHQQAMKASVASDPAVTADLSTRMFDPSHPTTVFDVIRAENNGQLSHTDANIMRENVQRLEETPLKDPVYKETMKAAHDQLVVNVPGVPGKDNVGVQNYSAFVQGFVPQYLAKLRAGTLEPNALDTKDPDSMISKAMAPYKRSPQDRMHDYVAGMGGIGVEGGATPEQSVRMIGNVAVPAKLNGVAALQISKDHTKWRDSTTGQIYDIHGNEIKQ